MSGKSERGRLAFTNPKVACFINSALQMITHISPLFVSSHGNEWYMFLKRLHDSKWSDDKEMLIVQNEFVVDKMNCLLPAQAHYHEKQEDAHEFFKHFLDGFKNDPLIESVLGGRRLYVTTCMTCGEVSKRREAFQQFEVNLNTDSSHKQINYFTEYFTDLFRTEELRDQNAYECANCTKIQKDLRTPATREQGILVYPKFLLFQLLRFNSGMKSTQKFLFHHTFKGKSEQTDPRYELVCIIVHMGQSVNSGHYVCYGRVQNTADDGTIMTSWLAYNDKVVTEIAEVELTNESICQNVYMLLYEKVPWKSIK